MSGTPLWLAWADEIQRIAQAGLYFNQNVYDRERYQRLSDLSAEIVSRMTEVPPERVRDLFCGDAGYLTPKMDTRAAIFDEAGRILLVREATGLWALPGGWIDTDCSVRENAVKEVREETGLEATAERIIAVLDRDKNNDRLFPRKIIMCFVECAAHGGQFEPNSETVETAYFAPEELPSPLATTKTTAAEIAMCFRAHADPHWQTIFD